MPALWPWLRLLAGIASAVVFVQTSGWCLAHLADHGRPTWGATIFTGPGAGIALSGLVASILVSQSITAAMGWVVFGLLALVLSSLVWRIFIGPNIATPVTVQPTVTEPEAMLSGEAADVVEREIAGAERSARASLRTGVTKPASGRAVEMLVFTLAYGIAGFGYIITATFLPVIARAALPGSVWLDLFWPILGFGVVIGALIAARVPARFDPRLLLIACYLLQAIGVALTLFLTNLAGFIAGSLLVGLPFTAISFFAMQDVRRLRPHHAARFMGLLTAAYGIGQIVGPPLVSQLLRLSTSPAQGFAWSLTTASTALLIGAVLYLIMWLCWPINIRSSKA